MTWTFSSVTNPTEDLVKVGKKGLDPFRLVDDLHHQRKILRELEHPRGVDPARGAEAEKTSAPWPPPCHDGAPLLPPPGRAVSPTLSLSLDRRATTTPPTATACPGLLTAPYPERSPPETPPTPARFAAARSPPPTSTPPPGGIRWFQNVGGEGGEGSQKSHHDHRAFPEQWSSGARKIHRNPARKHPTFTTSVPRGKSELFSRWTTPQGCTGATPPPHQRKPAKQVFPSILHHSSSEKNAPHPGCGASLSSGDVTAAATEERGSPAAPEKEGEDMPHRTLRPGIPTPLRGNPVGTPRGGEAPWRSGPHRPFTTPSRS